METDPICGMPVDPATALSARRGDEVAYFCSDFCRREYLRRTAGRGAVFHEARPSRRIAYLSMEIAVDPRMPTYAGGLGVLAGDTLRACADLRVAIVGVTLVHRHGYFAQVLSGPGIQEERPDFWSPGDLLTPLEPTVAVEVEGRLVKVRAWRKELIGFGGFVVPVLFLDTDLPENAPADRHLTDVLYGGDEAYRLSQEIVLGIGGVRMLRAAGYEGVHMYHLNEGHAALAALELLREQNHGRSGDWDFHGVRERCVFTTHTPVAAGHDQFDYGLVHRVLGAPVPAEVLAMVAGAERMNMTLLALNLSHYVNGVARRHGEVADQLYPGRGIGHITNGVHSATWVCDSFAALYDRHLPGWQDDPAMLRKAESIPPGEIWHAHEAARARLFAQVTRRTGQVLSPEPLTLGFARRSTEYKRADLVFHDLERLRALGRGRLQLVFAGKAHPRDETGKALIRQVHELGARLGSDVKVVYLPGYDLELARLLVSGVDLWLNTPLRPLEASGTSGMKAAHNGVPSFSVLDGWWVEGCVEGITGWSIGTEQPVASRREADAHDAADLYEKLERLVLPTFRDRERWVAVMQHCISLNASYFNTHRMVQQYVTNAYLA
ncbi:MAG: alpha-glucan family phosphorylase [Myxococcaceae bacterium]